MFQSLYNLIKHNKKKNHIVQLTFHETQINSVETVVFTVLLNQDLSLIITDRFKCHDITFF